jgi:predicted TIM-barrel fold metal-dependent hydrolase
MAAMRRLLDKGNTWIKLSGAYLHSEVGAPSYSDYADQAAVLVAAAPERLLWGSDWPHVTAKGDKPDGARLFDLLAEWVPDAGLRRRVLVHNPGQLYGFG